MKDYPYVPGWRQNKENNKPAIKHSVLMFTTHGIAEGEWVGNEWVQYRWSCKVKDTEVLYWMHLEDLTQLEKEGDCFQQEKPDNEDIDKVAQELYEHLYELKRRNNVPTNLYDKQEIIDLWKAGLEYGRNHPKQVQEQPEVDLEKEIDNYYYDNLGFIIGPNDTKDIVSNISRHFYELGLNARKED